MAAGDVYLPIKTADGLECAIARIAGNPRVYLQITITDRLKGKFDEHRLALVWFDGEVALDFCLLKSLDAITMKLSPPTVSFSLEDRTVSGAVWHGHMDEGTGIIGRLLKTNQFMIRIYFDDYTSREFVIEHSELVKLKQGIKSEILRL
jgi:hypothetical protein